MRASGTDRDLPPLSGEDRARLVPILLRVCTTDVMTDRRTRRLIFYKQNSKVDLTRSKKVDNHARAEWPTGEIGIYAYFEMFIS